MLFSLWTFHVSLERKFLQFVGSDLCFTYKKCMPGWNSIRLEDWWASSRLDLELDLDCSASSSLDLELDLDQ